jgi:PelA/Pel-15E family pectate lyase
VAQPVFAKAPDEKKVLETMKQATRFMIEKASFNGGFVWSYLPDFSRSWGEVEAKRTMAWVQSPGTPAVGQLLLDAYHATGDEYYYEAAKKTAGALIWGQLECGGWNYMFDFAGENSLKQWYATTGKSAWRLEEFQHYYGNATFDDAATVDAAKFLLRLYVEKNDPVFRPALDKAIRFVLESQYPIGGWPQRYPLKYDHVFHGKADYSSFITLNDDVTPENIDFLLQCYQAAGLQNLREPLMRAMNLMIALQQGAPYAGWADQYTVDDLQPAHARSYEPRSINSGTTVRMIHVMINYYKLTGDTKFLARIPEAIAFLKSQALPESEVRRFNRTSRESSDILVPRFICPESGKPQYVHRRGSNVYNGAYYVDEDIANTIGHYASASFVNIPNLEKAYQEALSLSPAELKAKSPLFSTERIPLPKYHTAQRFDGGYLEEQVTALIQNISKEGYWLSPVAVSYPYKEYLKEGVAYSGNEYASTNVGDEYDTSCFRKEGNMGISTGVYIANMTRFIAYLDSIRQNARP